MKRICMIVHAVYPIGEPRVQREAEALLYRGDQVDVICLRNPNEMPVEQVNGATVYRMPVGRHKGRGLMIQLLEYLAFFALALWQVTRLHLRCRYDVIHIHNLPDFLVFAALIPRLTGARVILDIHDLMPEFYGARFGTDRGHLAVQLLKLEERLSCHFAHRVITVSEPWRETLAARLRDPGRVMVVMNVADDQVFQSLRARGCQPSTTGRCHLIYHGTLTERYGIDLAIRAVDLVRSEVPHVHLTIHGRGEYLDALCCLVGELHLNDHVSFSTQLVPIDELPRLIAQADIGLVPYRRNLFTDGILPTKLMEYVALGVPAIVARTPAVEAYFDETMVQFFEAGRVDELARCILALYRDPARAEALTHNAEHFTAHYNWQTQRQVYYRLVDQLCAGSRSVPACGHHEIT